MMDLQEVEDVALTLSPVILSPALVILSPSPVILSEAKDLGLRLRAQNDKARLCGFLRKIQ